jgi:hypothetical protein
MSINNKGNQHLNQEEKTVLLEHLAAQYKIYREEVRLYAGFAATSTTLLLLLLFSELTAATGKDNTVNPKFYVLIPLSLVWYGAILAFFMSHVVVIESYTRLIEQKMNSLLNSKVFQFESKYRFPRLDKADLFPIIVFVLIAGLIPIVLALQAGHKGLVEGYGWSVFSAWLFVVGCVLVFGLEVALVIWIRFSRHNLNRHLKQEWETPSGNVSNKVNT